MKIQTFPVSTKKWSGKKKTDEKSTSYIIKKYFFISRYATQAEHTYCYIKSSIIKYRPMRV